MFRVVRRLLLDLFRYFARGNRPAGPGHSPPDQYALKPVPRKRGPYDRSAAVAVAEPEDE